MDTFCSPVFSFNIYVSVTGKVILEHRYSNWECFKIKISSNGCIPDKKIGIQLHIAVICM